MKRTEWLLGILLSLILIAIAGLLFFEFVWPQLTTQENLNTRQNTLVETIATPAFSGSTALTGLGLAQQEANSWAADAVLLSATATWPPGMDFRSSEVPWTYTFHSSQKGMTALIAVAGGAANKMSERASSGTNLQLQPIGAWEFDSRDVINLLYQSGGEAFVSEQEDATMILTLTNGEPIIWEAILFAQSGGQSFNIRVNAQDGTLMNPD